MGLRGMKITEVLRRQTDEAYHWKMSKTNAEYADSEPPARFADVSFRQREEEEEEEDEEEEDGNGQTRDDDEEEDNDGYSVMSSPISR